MVAVLGPQDQGPARFWRQQKFAGGDV